MSKFGICGISGRMGRAILNSMFEKKIPMGAAFDSKSSPFYGKDPGAYIINEDTGCLVSEISSEEVKKNTCVIDFSAPSATMRLLNSAIETKTALVIATTGFSPDEEEEIKNAAKAIPIVKSTNMSVGVNLLFKLVETAAKALSNDYDIEVFEAHHRHKKDSPSGTAKTIIDSIKKGKNNSIDFEEKYRGNGITGPRDDKELGVQVLRGGGIVGEHTAYFVSEFDRIEITHRAGDRKIFAEGAIKAALFAEKAEPGFYTMFDVLDIG
jgi:4-hydroxy-tetrahydrodipicolinate reductase